MNDNFSDEQWKQWYQARMKQFPHLAITLTEWREAVLGEAENRKFIHRAYSETISDEAAILEVATEE